MNTQDRKSAIDAYKNRKPAMGVFAVTCSASGEVWVSQSRNLDSQQSAIWFALRVGGARYVSMQPAWNAHGETSFSFRVLQQLDEEETRYPDSTLKPMRTDWQKSLAARPA